MFEFGLHLKLDEESFDYYSSYPYMVLKGNHENHTESVQALLCRVGALKWNLCKSDWTLNSDSL